MRRGAVFRAVFRVANRRHHERSVSGQPVGSLDDWFAVQQQRLDPRARIRSTDQSLVDVLSVAGNRGRKTSDLGRVAAMTKIAAGEISIRFLEFDRPIFDRNLE